MDLTRAGSEDTLHHVKAGVFQEFSESIPFRIRFFHGIQWFKDFQGMPVPLQGFVCTYHDVPDKD